MRISVTIGNYHFFAVVIDEIVQQTISQEITGLIQSEYSKGNYIVVSDPAPMPTPSREIDARRLRLALLQLGHLATVEAAVASLGQAAVIDWEYATTIREDYPLAQALSSQLGLDVDAVFDLAGTLA